jgi:hypothetical protein
LFHNSNKKEAKEKQKVKKDDSECINCLHFAVTWSVLVNSLLQSFPNPFKSVKKCFGKQFQDERKQIGQNVSKKASFGIKHRVDSNSNSNSVSSFDLLSIELLLCLAIDSFSQTLQNMDNGLKANNSKCLNETPFSKPEDSSPPQFDHLRLIKALINGKKAGFDGFMSNLRFARVGGAPAATLVGPTDSPVRDETDSHVTNESEDRENGLFPQNFATGLLNIPLSNVERLRSTISAVSLAELVEFIPNLGKSGADHPDKKKLFSVQDFFRYTETEGATTFLSFVFVLSFLIIFFHSMPLLVMVLMYLLSMKQLPSKGTSTYLGFTVYIIVQSKEMWFIFVPHPKFLNISQRAIE